VEKGRVWWDNTCYPSNQEDHGQGRSYLKITRAKRAGGRAPPQEVCSPEFIPQHVQINKKTNKSLVTISGLSSTIKIKKIIPDFPQSGNIKVLKL
jgi:hypothetical protein